MLLDLRQRRLSPVRRPVRTVRSSNASSVLRTSVERTPFLKSGSFMALFPV